MKAPNGMWVITIDTMTGPWHVASYRNNSLWYGFCRNYWYIVNMLTGRAKRIGRVKLRGVNYFDRACEVAKERNKAFLAQHMADKSLPQFLGINPEFDKTIAQCLQGDKQCT
jgi:hypothetical protein